MSSEPLCYICQCQKLYDLDESFHEKTITCNNCSAKAYIEIVNGVLSSKLVGDNDSLNLEEVDVKKKKKEPLKEVITKKGWGKKKEVHLSEIKKEQIQRIQKEKLEQEEHNRKEAQITRCPNCRDKDFKNSKTCLKCHYSTFGYYERDLKPVLIEKAILVLSILIASIFGYLGFQNGLTNRPFEQKPITEKSLFKFEEKSADLLKLFLIKPNFAHINNAKEEDFSIGIIIEKGKCLIKLKKDYTKVLWIQYDKRKTKCNIIKVEKWNDTTTLIHFEDPKSSRKVWSIKQTPPINTSIRILDQINQYFYHYEEVVFHQPFEITEKTEWAYGDYLIFDYDANTVYETSRQVETQ